MFADFYLPEFDHEMATMRRVLARVPDARADWRPHPKSTPLGTQVFFSLPRAAAPRSYLLSHSIHHRGQLSVYLRLLDVPVPSIYGPTADEAK